MLACSKFIQHSSYSCGDTILLVVCRAFPWRARRSRSITLLICLYGVSLHSLGVLHLLLLSFPDSSCRIYRFTPPTVPAEHAHIGAAAPILWLCAVPPGAGVNPRHLFGVSTCHFTYQTLLHRHASRERRDLQHDFGALPQLRAAPITNDDRRASSPWRFTECSSVHHRVLGERRDFTS